MGNTRASRADLAGKAEQIITAERVLDAQGWDAWPACSAELGLDAGDKPGTPSVVVEYRQEHGDAGATQDNRQDAEDGPRAKDAPHNEGSQREGAGPERDGNVEPEQNPQRDGDAEREQGVLMRIVDLFD